MPPKPSTKRPASCSREHAAGAFIQRRWARTKGYHVKDFIAHLRKHAIRPHIARIEGRRTPGLDGRTTRTESYRISQRKRKRVEEIFGWLKTVGGLRKSRFIGQAKTQMAAFLSGAAYNLLRIAKLTEAGATS